jgi:hypothetical protein
MFITGEKLIAIILGTMALTLVVFLTGYLVGKGLYS